jgi:small nuclear ribonucleoprotein (snRNP)-like protein
MSNRWQTQYFNYGLYRELKEYEDYVVTIRTRSGDLIQGVLDDCTKYGIAKIIQQDTLSPFMEEQLTFIRIDDIEYFSVTDVDDDDDDD